MYVLELNLIKIYNKDVLWIISIIAIGVLSNLMILWQDFCWFARIFTRLIFFSKEIHFDIPFARNMASGILQRGFNTFTTLLREKFVFNEWLNRKIIILCCSVFYGLFLELKFPTDIQQQCSGNPNKRKFKSTSKWPRFIDTNRSIPAYKKRQFD